MSNESIMKTAIDSSPQGLRKTSKSLWFGIILGLVLIVALVTAAYRFLQEQEQGKEEEIQRQQYSTLVTRTEHMQNWINSMVDLSKRLVGADIFMLFAEEMNSLPEGVPLLFADPKANLSAQGDTAEQLFAQLPLMKNMLSEFVAYSEFSEARIVTSRGEPYLSSGQLNPITAEQTALAKASAKAGRIAYGPLTVRRPGNLILDIYIPIFPSQDGVGKASAVLIVSANAYTKLTEVLSSGPHRAQMLELNLVQQGEEAGTYMYYAKDAQVFYPVTGITVNEKGEIPFVLAPTLGGSGQSYRSGIELPSLRWWIVAEQKKSYISGPMQELSKMTYSIVGLLSSVLILCLLAAWWWAIGRRQGTINEEFRCLLVVIEEQKKLLDGINNTISDPISLTDDKGVFVYVNKAFAHAVGRTDAECIGLDGPAIFGFDTAKRLNIPDQTVRMTGETVTVNEVLWLQSRRYDFQISKTALKDATTRTSQGIVSVYRDLTQLVETEKRSRRVVQQTIDALVLAIEEADPFLGGHSRIMGSVAASIAKQMQLNEKDIATIEAAANLSQIGKMFVPREILLKPGALTAEEKHQIEEHTLHAQKILSGIEFDLPVIEVITQMNERMDGTGYPHGLTGDQISIDARILAVANAFAAMARPRSYRAAMPIEQVISVLESDSDHVFDARVVEAFRQVLSSPAGERITTQAANAKAV